MAAFQEVVTVRSTESASATATAAAKVKLPVGAIAGGTVAGVLVVIFAGLFWWWWVANKPREMTPEERQARRRPLPKTAPGVVPQPVSTTRPSASKNPYSEKAVPLSSLRSSPTRSTSGTPLLAAAASASESSVVLPIVNKHAPVKPSPLASSRIAAPIEESPTYPKWGEVPFVAPPLAPFSGSHQQSIPPPTQETYYEQPAGSSNGIYSADPRSVDNPFAGGSPPTEVYPQEKIGYLTVGTPAGKEVRRTSNVSAVSEGSMYSNADEDAYDMVSVNAYSGQQPQYQQHAPPYGDQRR
ncbi:hypothetical protein [Phaffia rhodozyma]|uniref:Transmembrane protein n=1 Tax=Phaffia rhodozyma TaxID=264483 RepID=A0A0F7SPY6_PHARH|nr:hypothetical protein [Phaffia rhodozyma]